MRYAWTAASGDAILTWFLLLYEQLSSFMPSRSLKGHNQDKQPLPVRLKMHKPKQATQLFSLHGASVASFEPKEARILTASGSNAHVEARIRRSKDAMVVASWNFRLDAFPGAVRGRKDRCSPEVEVQQRRC